MNAVVVKNISKHYSAAKITAVKDVSLDVKKGELFGIIGPDGAGKTSLFRMLTTLLLPDSGEAWVEGLNVVKDFRAIRRKVGYMPGRFSLYPDLSVEENLNFFATIFNTTVRENYGLIKDIYVQLEPFKTRKAGKLSGGMKQKLALSCALIHKPDVLFLDEPTTGVDAVSRREFWEMLQRLKQQDITIVVSTPYMDEASLCDRVALMQGGSIMTTGTPQEIMASFGKPILAVRATDMFRLLRDLAEASEVEHVYSFGEYHHAVMKEGFDEFKMKAFLSDKGHEQVEIKAVPATIEDCFMELMEDKHE